MAAIVLAACGSLDAHPDRADAETTDSGVSPSSRAPFTPADGDADALGMISLNAGDLVLTEIMRNPSAVGDDVGEWFELYNATTEPIDLAGLEIADDHLDAAVIAEHAIVAAGASIVVSLTADPAVNGGVAVGATPTGAMVLANESDELEIRANGRILDRVAWDADWPDEAGAAMQLSVGSEDDSANDLPGVWCAATTEYGDGDLGTPGAPNSVCAGLSVDEDGDGYEASVDCDDGDSAVHPGAIEVCDGLDNDCDPATSEAGLVTTDSGLAFGTIGDAVAAVGEEGTVFVCPGTYAEALYLWDRSIELIGVGGAENVILDASGTGDPVIYVGSSFQVATDVVVEGLTLTGGTRGIENWSEGTLTVRHAIITGNAPDGGVFSWEAFLTFEDVEISHNTSWSGGAVYLAHTILDFQDVQMIENVAELGGAVFLSDEGGLSGTRFTNCSFHGNEADLGGALYITDKVDNPVEVIDSDFGVGGTDNTPEDVYFGYSTYFYDLFSFGAGATFTCWEATDTCQ